MIQPMQAANTGRVGIDYLEGDEYKEEAMVQQPDDGFQLVAEASVGAVTMVVDCGEVKTASEVQSQRNTEYAQLNTTHTLIVQTTGTGM